MLGKIQLSHSAVLTLLVLGQVCSAQSSPSLSSGQNTWGIVPESSRLPSNLDEPTWRTAQNLPSSGVPTPAEREPTPLVGEPTPLVGQPTPLVGEPTPLVGQPTPADPRTKEPETLPWSPSPASDNFDSQPGILQGPTNEPTNEPQYDPSLTIGPGGYAKVPETRSEDKSLQPFILGDGTEQGYVIGPDGEMILDDSGTWPGMTEVGPPPPPKTRFERHFPIFSTVCHRNFPVMYHGAQRLAARHRARKACPPPQCTTAHWFYGGFEYLHWWTRGMTVPAVITTSPDGTPVNEAGVLGFPTTTSLLGPGRLDAQDNAGGRFNFGFYLDPCHCKSIETDYFLLDGSRFSTFAQAPQDVGTLARPYVNSLTGAQAAELVGYPGITQGSILAVGETDFMGGGVALRRNLYCGSGIRPGNLHVANGLNRIDNGFGWACSKLQWIPGGGIMPIRVDGIMGWRAYELQEQFTINENRTATDPMGAVPVGTTTAVLDQFETRNTFHGLVLGTDTDWSQGRWGVVSRLKVSLGQMRRRATIAGSTTVATPGVATVSYNAGLQALASNIGSYADSEFIAVPEVGFDTYYLLRPHMRIKAGYTFLYLTDVWRPGTVLDTSLDPRLIPPPTVATADRPQLIPSSDDFWVQGINLGVEWRY